MTAIDIVEPMAVVDTFVSGSGPVEVLGPNLRVRLFVVQSSDGRTERAVVAKIVGSVADMRQLAREILKADDKSLALLESVRNHDEPMQ